MNFPSILIQYFGKWLGTCLLFSYCIYFILAGFVALLRCIDIVIVWILPNTPPYQIALLLLIPFYILAKDSIFAVYRYNEVIFFLTLFLPGLLIFALKEGFYPVHLFPIIKEGWLPIFRGLKETIYPYSGLEIAYILYPFLKKKKKQFQVS
ncbi:GerAB/ArcD/ProY family transporter [Bacillus mycoides]|nr:GerAB/ArcD/ProY family transporter [Bacillus mycoides]